ncbi:GADL1 decarboxylase, partial [Polyodon spathula]|nr:GADL1 decarboxylase [Polyodon spathula]
MNSKAGERFVEEAFPIIMEEAIRKATDVNEKVCEWQPPEELKQLLDLDLREGGEAPQQILKRCKDVIKYSVKTGHPRFFNQLYAGMDHYSLVARFITEAINPSVYTFEVSPTFVMIEEVILKKMIEYVGWKEGGDGIFSPGGSVSNMYAVNLARYKHCPSIKDEGLSGMPRLVMFTSEECHYSIGKAAAFLGIGTKNVYVVPADERGKMIPEELEKQVQRAVKEGAVPFIVCATAGTTVLGAFDPLEKIADICQKHGLWFHVDASWGGGALMSNKHCHLLNGIQRADSVAWNPHKMLMAGLQCCAFLVKDKTGLFEKCHSSQASYLFQQDKFYDVSYDTGDKSIQCSRRADAFKFWLMWKAVGTRGLEDRVNRALALASYVLIVQGCIKPQKMRRDMDYPRRIAVVSAALNRSHSYSHTKLSTVCVHAVPSVVHSAVTDAVMTHMALHTILSGFFHSPSLVAVTMYLAEEIKKKEGFRLILEPEYANVCFWYIPPSLRNMPDGPEFWKKLHQLWAAYKQARRRPARLQGSLVHGVKKHFRSTVKQGKLTAFAVLVIEKEVAPVIKERMMKKGSVMVGYQPHRDKVNFFRQIIISPQVSREDMDFVLQEIEALGKDL